MMLSGSIACLINGDADHHKPDEHRPPPPIVETHLHRDHEGFLEIGGVTAVQMDLRVLDLYPRRPDGIMGPETKRAIELFEKANGLPVTGDPQNPDFKKRLIDVIEKFTAIYPSAFAFSK